MKPYTILGIETSCDETAAAVYHEEKGILSSELFSQIEIHKAYGGVVPEIASRSQLEKITPIVQHALDAANVTMNDIDVVAVTSKPGLASSLLVGVCFAKAIAWANNKKLIGVNHLEGHAFSSFVENDVPFPHLCITASGGHTALYIVRGFGDYEVIGQTIDDAAGEAFDKIAKLMYLPYPGGPVIEKLAAQANFEQYFVYPAGKKDTLDFSFSGLKTAVLYDLVKKGAYDMATKKFLKSDDEELKSKVASSLLYAIAQSFEQKVTLALSKHPEARALTFVGGVACNKFIVRRMKELCARHAIPFFSPSPRYCTDNAAMIALVGCYKARQEKFNDFNLDVL